MNEPDSDSTLLFNVIFDSTFLLFLLMNLKRQLFDIRNFEYCITEEEVRIRIFDIVLRCVRVLTSLYRYCTFDVLDAIGIKYIFVKIV